jgi:hypothetical protein
MKCNFDFNTHHLKKIQNPQNNEIKRDKMCFSANFCELKTMTMTMRLTSNGNVIFHNKFFERLCISNTYLESKSLIFYLKNNKWFI